MTETAIQATTTTTGERALQAMTQLRAATHTERGVENIRRKGRSRVRCAAGVTTVMFSGTFDEAMRSDVAVQTAKPPRGTFTSSLELASNTTRLAATDLSLLSSAQRSCNLLRPLTSYSYAALTRFPKNIITNA